MAVPRKDGRRLRYIVPGTALGVIVVLLLWLTGLFDRSPEVLLRDARLAMEQKDYAAAEETALRVPVNHPRWTESRLLAGAAAFQAGRLEPAVSHFRSIPRSETDDSLAAVLSLAGVYVHSGQLSRAEGCFAHVLKHQPDNLEALHGIVFLLHATRQNWKARPYDVSLLRAGDVSPSELSIIAVPERFHDSQRDYLSRSSSASPDDLLVRLAINAQPSGAANILQRVDTYRYLIKDQPTLLATQALLGQMLVARHEFAFSDWNKSLPPNALEHPEIWFVRGLWHRRKDRLTVAARCFWEALRRDPNHRRAANEIGDVLDSLNDSSGKEFLQRSETLSRLAEAVDLLDRPASGERELQSITDLLRQLGRFHEAVAWAELAGDRFPAAAWSEEVIADLTPRLAASPSLTFPSFDLAARHDLSRFPLPTSQTEDSPASVATATSEESESALRFDEEAQQVGIDFQYFNGDNDLTRPGARMHEQTGGGVAVIDFNCDGWPDLFFPQGCYWAPGSTSPTPDGKLSDRLFQNLDGQRFADVTSGARVVDRSFGQGMAVGDFNNDGFPDLYVANIGRNHLYQNNGDGTFSDATGNSGLPFHDWTTSCLIADLNGDGNPDLFDVNYVEGDDVFVRVCDGFGCSPKHFRGIHDRLLLSSGDGRFTGVSSLTPADQAKGLGILAFNLRAGETPSLFIANDQVPNFLLKLSPGNTDSEINCVNEATVTGLAFNEEGLALASMGIAAGDADGNGSLDFFVSNFQDETNTLYLHDSTGLYLDATKLSGLRDAGLPYVGWGTQFLDADLDGDIDLVVANGHVDDQRAESRGYEMPALLYQKSGRLRFTLCDPNQSGSFFKRYYRGRGLSKLDWNRDGRLDFVVSNLNEYAALGTNRTDTSGAFLNLRLHATGSARDAIGSVVRVTAGPNQYRTELVGGDGYMASNERMLQFGLGAITEVPQLTVDWPSGQSQTLHQLPVNVTIDLVEGGHSATVWRGLQPEALVIP